MNSPEEELYTALPYAFVQSMEPERACPSEKVNGQRRQIVYFTDRHRERAASAAPEDVAEVLNVVILGFPPSHPCQ